MEDRATRLSAHAVCMARGEVLLVHLAPPLPDAGMWGLPGGGLDWGEPPEDGVVRELREETGYDVEVQQLLGIYSTVFDHDAPDDPFPTMHFVSVLYVVEVAGGELVHEIGGTTDEARWVRLGEVTDLPLTDHALYGLHLALQ